MILIKNLLVFSILLTGAWAGGLEDSHQDPQVEVLVLYKDQSSVELQKSELKPAAYVKLMKRRTLETQEAVFSSVGMLSSAKKALWLINGSVVRIHESQREALVQHPLVQSVNALTRKPHLITGIESEAIAPAANEAYTYGLTKIGVPEVRAKNAEMDGRGVKVGIIDTGIAPNHPDLQGKVKAFHDFTVAKDSATVRDDHGHGSHVAGTIAGGMASGTAIGVAPGAELIIAKGFTGGGASTEAGLLESLQWMADPDDKNGELTPKIISNSWGMSGSVAAKDPATDPFCMAVSKLKGMGIVSVFAAGNSGPREGSIGVPGACPDAFTVGATDANDRIANFSSRGPVQWKTMTLIKPDVVAPGVNISSAAFKGGYTNMSGTSMATPHVAGALAVLSQAQPDVATPELAKTLKETTVDLGTAGEDSVYGSGRIDLMRSVYKSKAGSLDSAYL